MDNKVEEISEEIIINELIDYNIDISPYDLKNISSALNYEN